MAINNIKATINTDSVNYSPVGVVKTDDTVMLELSVLKAGELVDFTEQEIYISALRSDNELVQQESFIAVNNTTLKILLNNKFNCLAGIVKCELTIKDSEGATTTADFYFRVNSRIMSEENLDKTGYIETLDKVKLEFVESSTVLKEDFTTATNKLKTDFTESMDKLKADFLESSAALEENFRVNSTKALDDFNAEGTASMDSFNTQSTTAIDNVNTVANDVKEKSGLLLSEFGINSANELNRIKEEAALLNKEAIANNKITLDEFMNTTTIELVNFNTKSQKALDDFNTTATTQLEKQREDYGALEKVIIDENVAAEFEQRLQKLEYHHRPAGDIATEVGKLLLTENGLTLITE